MAIQLYCQVCKSYVPTASKKCPKCSAAFPREGRKYRADVTVKGKRVTRFCDNLTLAREVEGTIRSDLVREAFDITHPKAKKAVTLDDVWEEYLPWAKTNKKKSWFTDDFFYRKHLKKHFGSKALEDISPFDIEGMKQEMKQATTPQGKKGYSDATIRHQLVLLGHLFVKAREWGMYDGKNPCETVKKPKLDNKVTEFLTDDEMQRLSETLDTWPCKQSADFVRIALYTGIRKSEIMKLRWAEVDLERKMVVLLDPTGKVSVTIPISDEAVEVFHGIERTSEYVIPGPDGGIKKTFRDPWYKIRKAAGLPERYRLHGLRHNFASQLVSNGVDLYTVSKLLTHKDVRTSERYSHLTDGALRQAAQKSGQLLRPKQKSDSILPMPADRT